MVTTVTGRRLTCIAHTIATPIDTGMAARPAVGQSQDHNSRPQPKGPRLRLLSGYGEPFPPSLLGSIPSFDGWLKKIQIARQRRWDYYCGKTTEHSLVMHHYEHSRNNNPTEHLLPRLISVSRPVSDNAPRNSPATTMSSNQLSTNSDFACPLT